MFSFLTGKTDRADTFIDRMERARSDGYSRGEHQARVLKLALGKDFQPEQAVDWINTAIDDGRSELQAQHAREREVEAWDMSCRIMFMVMIADDRS